MELELGLALPNTCWMKGFDLNVDIGHCRKKRRSEKAFVCEDADNGGNDGSDTSLESPYCLKKSMRVKVKMEGVAIGRKVDLSLLNSYQALNCALRQMFPSHLYDTNRGGGDEGMDGGKERQKILQHHTYRLTYEDEEGDWLLVGDVPWETFIQSVKRLKILVN